MSRPTLTLLSMLARGDFSTTRCKPISINKVYSYRHSTRSSVKRSVEINMRSRSSQKYLQKSKERLWVSRWHVPRYEYSIVINSARRTRYVRLVEPRANLRYGKGSSYSRGRNLNAPSTITAIHLSCQIYRPETKAALPIRVQSVQALGCPGCRPVRIQTCYVWSSEERKDMEETMETPHRDQVTLEMEM